MINQNPRFLFISAMPFRQNATSRYLWTFLSALNKDEIAHFYTNSRKPSEDYCSSFFQVSDVMMLKKFFHLKQEVGKVFFPEDVEKHDVFGDKQDAGSPFINFLYKTGKKKTPFIYLLRDLIWLKNNWKTEKFLAWLDNFKPEAVFVYLSCDKYVFDISHFISRRFNVPIFVSIADDYYFSKSFSLSPFTWIFRHNFRKRLRLLALNSSCFFYISEKMKAKYETVFDVRGEVIHFSSGIDLLNNEEAHVSRHGYFYFGSVNLGRWKGLIEIGRALHSIDKTKFVDVYSYVYLPSIKKKLDNSPGIRLHSPIPYSEVIQLMSSSEICFVVESFEPKNIRKTLFSLSSKTADSLSCGTCIFAYGPIDAGVISYLNDSDSAIVVAKKSDLESKLSSCLFDKKRVFEVKVNAREMAKKNHCLENNSSSFRDTVGEISRNKKTN